MVHLPEDDTKKVQQEWRSADASPSGSNSGSATNLNAGHRTQPVFDNTGTNETDHLLVDFPEPPQHNYSDPPPDFTPYEAEHFEVGYKDVVSHDPHLNSDGEALYRFLLSQSETPPTYRLTCKGTHTETRYRTVHERREGRNHTRTESYTETITDFDFCIDITPDHSELKGVQWSVPDDEPVYRGKMVREFETEEGPLMLMSEGKKKSKKASRKEVKGYKKWLEEREGRGYPPWVRQLDVLPTTTTSVAAVDAATAPVATGLRSSKTVRQWADEYCASPKYLKEFVYHKVLYGWNLQQIESAVRGTIAATPYNGCTTVSIQPYNSTIYIRPDNRISRMLSNKWLKFLSIILLVYPFVWLFKRFHSRGGGKWEVCGAAYALKQWVPLEDEERHEVDQLPPYNPFGGPAAQLPLTMTTENSRQTFTYRQTTLGPRKLVGMREGEWFRDWEPAITRAVIGKYQSDSPLQSSQGSSLQARELDGYEDNWSLGTSLQQQQQQRSLIQY